MSSYLMGARSLSFGLCLHIQSKEVDSCENIEV